MIGKRLNLSSVTMPKILADLKHANQLLKVFALFAFSLALVESLLLTTVLNKSVSVVALDVGGQRLELLELPNPEAEIENALREYVKRRYAWEPKTVSEQLKKASAFIHQSMRSQYFNGVSKVERFASDRGVSQMAYVDHVEVDLKNSSARITGNRVTTIQGLRAAGQLKLTLYFESSTRTPENPWGIYVRQEKEESVP